MQLKNTEAIKWIALVLMLGDHVNKYLFNESLPFLYEAGRTVMPMFCVVLAYNLARPDTLAKRYISESSFKTDIIWSTGITGLHSSWRSY
jgi:TraX protein.